jgi:hypothetical protein
MKAIRIIVLLLFSAVAFSCSKDDDNTATPDYSVLGVTSVTINGQQIKVNKGILLDLGNTTSVISNGFTNYATQKHAELSYTIRTSSGTTPSVSVMSSYPDASSVVVKNTSGTTPSFTVTVTRNGYEEQLTYHFNFIVN